MTDPHDSTTSSFLDVIQQFTPEQFRAALDMKVDTLSHPAANDGQRALEEAFLGLCRKHRIGNPPRILFSDFPNINAEAVHHRNTILIHSDLMEALPNPRHQLAIVAHELGHLLEGTECIGISDATRLRVEYTCDRLAVALLGHSDDLIEALKKVEAAQAKAHEDIYAVMEENEREGITPAGSTQQFRTQYEERARTINEALYGTSEQRLGAISQVDPANRTELTAAIRQYQSSHAFRA